MDQLLVLPRQDIHHVIDLLVNRKAFIIKPADGYLAGSLFVFHVIEGICRVHALDDGLELGGEGAQLLRPHLLGHDAEGKIYAGIQTGLDDLRPGSPTGTSPAP